MRIFAKTDIGKARDMNQDSYYISTPNDDIKLFILADGMGGYEGRRSCQQTSYRVF